MFASIFDQRFVPNRAASKCSLSRLSRSSSQPRNYDAIVRALLLLITISFSMIMAAPISTSITTTLPPTTTELAKQQQQQIASVSDQKASASNDANTNSQAPTKAEQPLGNGNVYALEAAPGAGAGGAGGASNGGASGRPATRGYNQGYSYNSGVKPYTTGYTYYQPFGDAVNDHNQNNQGAGNNQAGGQQQPQPHQQQAISGAGKAGAPQAQAMPIDLPNIFGIDAKQFGPVKVIPNQNVPVDENGIPQLDQIPIPQNNQAIKPMRNVGAPMQQAQPPPPPPPIPVNMNDFGMGNDFNINQILSSVRPTAPPPPPPPQQQNNNGMFDFAPPSTQNFDFAQNGGGAGDDPSLMMDNTGGGGNGGGGGGGGGGGLGDGTGLGDLADFGAPTQQQQPQQQPVPSEIVNLNNAFGTNTNQASNNDMMNILNQLNSGGGGQQTPNDGTMDFGNFGTAATNRDQLFPFF